MGKSVAELSDYPSLPTGAAGSVADDDRVRDLLAPPGALAPAPESKVVSYPFRDHPAAGEAVQVAAGIFWISTPLPFRLRSVNCYMIDDGDGWTVVDCGYSDPSVHRLWERIWSKLLGGRPVTRLVLTHFHPDHAGNSAFISERWAIRPAMTQPDWLAAQLAASDLYSDDIPSRCAFFCKNGISPALLETFRREHVLYRGGVALPPAISLLFAGDVLSIGGSRWTVIVGRGHSPEQAMLYSAERGVLIVGDQVLPQISPNVSVWQTEPEADPLGLFVTSLMRLRAMIAPGCLVLPAHGRPFAGLQHRCDELLNHHRSRLMTILAAARSAPVTAGSLLSLLFPRDLDGHQVGFAMGESLAHLNYLASRGYLRRVTRGTATMFECA